MNENSLKNLPPRFIKNISGLYGARGEKWLLSLPRAINEICGKWSLEIETVFPNLSFNFVAACVTRSGEKCVLKIGVPEKDSSLVYEKRALQAFNGRGAVRLFKSDAKLGALLIERAVEGKTLHEVCGEDYGQAVEIAADVMKKLPRDPPDKRKFINLETWTAELKRAAAINFEAEKVARARKFFAELAKPSEKKMLLHGDIHFDNILSARREPFLLIDPKGIVGEIGYEIAVFLNDLADWTSHLSNRKDILDAAVASFSESFAVSDQDLRKWAYSFAVLSAWWMMEDFADNQEKHILRAEIWQV